jgi:hypothetical protein
MLKKIVLFSLLFSLCHIRAKAPIVIDKAYVLLSQEQKKQKDLKKNPNKIGTVQYLIDTGQIPALVDGKLDLRNKNIVSLDGLENLPHIKIIKVLDLRHNKIKFLPHEDNFKGFLSLSILFIAHNYPPFTSPMKKKMKKNIKMGAPRCKVLF